MYITSGEYACNQSSIIPGSWTIIKRKKNFTIKAKPLSKLFAIVVKAKMAYIIRLEHGAAVGPKQTKKSTDQTTDRQTDQEEVALPIKMYKNYEEHIATNDW